MTTITRAEELQTKLVNMGKWMADIEGKPFEHEAAITKIAPAVLFVTAAKVLEHPDLKAAILSRNKEGLKEFYVYLLANKKEFGSIVQMVPFWPTAEDVHARVDAAKYTDDQKDKFWRYLEYFFNLTNGGSN